MCKQDLVATAPWTSMFNIKIPSFVNCFQRPWWNIHYARWISLGPFGRTRNCKLDNLFCLYSIDLQPLPSVRDNRLNFTFVPINWHNVQVSQKNFTNDRYLSGSSEQRFHKNNIFCSVTDTDTVRQTKILSKAKNQNKIHVVSFPWSIKPIMQQITHLHQISQFQQMFENTISN